MNAAPNGAPSRALYGAVAGPRIGSVCTGYGGLDMAVTAVMGGRLVWVADPDPGASTLLAHRYPGVPNLGDITTVDFTRVPAVDVLCAGWPCQDISNAGRRAGIQEGNRSGLWHVIADAVGVLRPRLLVLENVAALVVRRPGLDVVLSRLARLGFDAWWLRLPASHVGAPHQRIRWFGLAAPAGPAADTTYQRHQRDRHPRDRWPGPAHRGLAAAHPTGDGRHQGWPEPAGILRGPDPAVPGGTDRHGRDVIDWGRYAAAIARWEQVTGYPAPGPCEPSPRGGQRLSPAFTEWMMGLPAGWVTAVPGLTRNQQLTLLGNGVVPLQAASALATLLADAHPAPAPLRGTERGAA